MFHYSDYWHTWSRRLFTNLNPSNKRWIGFVDLNLTPIASCHSSSWDQVSMEIIRAHGTTSHDGDKDTDILPKAIVYQMQENLDSYICDKLLDFDYLNTKTGVTVEEILKAQSQSNGGGVPLIFIKHLRTHPTAYWMN